MVSTGTGELASHSGFEFLSYSVLVPHHVSDLFQKRREECERKARRGEMDPRLEFTFQLLTDSTGMSRSEVMDNVFEGNMVNLF